MKKKILAFIIMLTVVLTAAGCGNKGLTNDGNNKTNDTKKNVATIDDNDSYYIIINGTKFKVGDKISSLSKVGLKQSDREVDETLNANTYLIGGGSIYNSNNKKVLNVTAYNDTDSQVTIKDAKIGAVTIGTYEYAKLSSDELALNAEFVGGIKLGSSLEDITRVFGEPTSTYEAQSLGYTTYKYESSRVYRSFEFYVDKEGKVSQINFRNLVYNE